MARHFLPVALPALLMAPVLAAGLGGWATITVEDLPDHIVAGRPVELTFMVRQHGVSPLRGLNARVEARAGGREAAVSAAPGRKAGEYIAALTLPEPGSWTITIHSGFGKSTAKLLPIRVVSSATQAAASTPAVRGMHLFVAKGCVSCHTHQRVAAEGPVEVGPDLTAPRYQADYLAKFLADPSIRPPTSDTKRMPNLELKEPEIAALVAFLNGAPQGQRSSQR